MRAVSTWSFTPWLNNQGVHWYSTETMLAASLLSLERTEQFYGRPTLFCDSFTASIFKNLKASCEYELLNEDEINEVHPAFWMFPKLLTYREQTKPFVHFDLDLISHKRLPDRILSQPISFHNLETKLKDRYIYLEDPDPLIVLNDVFKRFVLSRSYAFNVGFVAFNDLDLSRRFAEAAIKMCKANSNVILEFEETRKKSLNCIIEQQLLALMTVEAKIDFAPFLSDQPAIFNPYFDHYIGGNKRLRRAQTVFVDRITPKIREVSKELNLMKGTTSVETCL